MKIALLGPICSLHMEIKYKSDQKAVADCLNSLGRLVSDDVPTLFYCLNPIQKSKQLSAAGLVYFHRPGFLGTREWNSSFVGVPAALLHLDLDHCFLLMRHTILRPNCEEISEFRPNFGLSWVRT